MSGVVDYTAAEADVRAWLASLVDHEASAAGISAGVIDGLTLDPMRRLLDVLGEPQRDFATIHITGTNGKGSVSEMITRLVAALGLRVGTYTSPDLGVVNERIRVDAETISDADLDVALGEVANAAQIAGVDPTRFEALTAAAFVHFSTSAVEVAVVEVGLLGRFDATNVVEAPVAVITSIGRDHTDGADGWARRIAEEKAGIVAEGSTVVVGAIDESLRGIVEAEGPAEVLYFGDDVYIDHPRVAVGGRVVDVVTPAGRYEDVSYTLHGAFQDHNVALALAATESLIGRRLPDDVVEEAMAQVSLPGRLQVLAHQPLVIVDGAHNAHASAALARAVDADFLVSGSRILCVGMLAGKDPEAFLEPFAALGFDLVIGIDMDGPRGLGADRIAAAASAAGIAFERGGPVESALSRALRLADEADLVLICGSVRLVAPATAAVVRWQQSNG